VADVGVGHREEEEHLNLGLFECDQQGKRKNIVGFADFDTGMEHLRESLLRVAR
jgi:hypothetical protein